RLHPALELGVGIGWIQFHSKGGGRDVTTSKPIVSLPRVIVMPLLAVPQWQDKRYLGFLKVYYRYTLIMGRLTDENFASKTGTVLDVKNERKNSAGLIFDLTPVFCS